MLSRQGPGPGGELQPDVVKRVTVSSTVRNLSPLQFAADYEVMYSGFMSGTNRRPEADSAGMQRGLPVASKHALLLTHWEWLLYAASVSKMQGSVLMKYRSHFARGQ